MKVEDDNFHLSTIHKQKKEVHDLEEGESWDEYYQFRESVLLGEITFDYQGSLLSQIRESQLPRELLELKKFFLAHQKSAEIGDDIPLILVLFRDADGTASSDRGEWEDKMRSILTGFEVEQMSTGVPMIPNPKSEAWVLCALRNKYQYCAKLEAESGNDNSPNSLKQQLENHLGETGTVILLNDKIDAGEIDIDRIRDMPSLTAFKQRLNEVLASLSQ